ncbi:hypothetical protein [Virgibacillus litoralis]|uniref:Uncharacterized protein n=1 Tax=Virgibacillus litoralis TaxID=578221 RepID=A0ABS4HGK2_9BACI|nr:hypothetical protein [Virgibacillus litoralis]MBP1950047.1 hypothetical protein [Virgibacillus litoralis]
MTIRDLYNDAVKFDESHVLLLLDFLLFEKRSIAFNDDVSVLELYFNAKHKERMNQLLLEYKRSTSNEVK